MKFNKLTIEELNEGILLSRITLEHLVTLEPTIENKNKVLNQYLLIQKLQKTLDKKLKKITVI